MYSYKEIWDKADVKTTIHGLLERTRGCTGTALDIYGEEMSYQAFHEQSDAAAAYLQQSRTGRKSGTGGDREVIIVSMKVSCLLYCVITGVVKSGAVVVVTEDDISPDRLKKIREQTNAVLQITDETAETIMKEGRELRFRPVEDSRAEDVFAVWYTSGSTGEPCGIRVIAPVMTCSLLPVPRNKILTDALGVCTALFNISHPAFTYGFCNFFYTILYGKKFVHIRMGTEHSFDDIADKIAENKNSFLFFTPSALLACLDYDRVRKSFLNVSGVMVGSDIVKPSLISDMRSVMNPDAKIVVLYGGTEVGLVTAREVKHPEKAHAVGHPNGYSEISIVDENRNALPAGEAGEVCVRGPRVNMGYIGAEDQKQKKFRFHPDGTRTFYTGDFGYLDENGELFVLGRMDRIIKHLGYRLDPVMIEEVMKQKGGVNNAAVKQIDCQGKSVLCAFYENPEKADHDALRRILSDNLPHYSIPERFVYLEKLPITNHGKLDYHALVLPEQEEPVPYEAPANQTEEHLCAVYEQVLKILRVGRNDSYFELGGDSIRAVSVLLHLKNRGLAVTIRDLFRNPKPKDLALYASHISPESGEKEDDRRDGSVEPEVSAWRLQLPEELHPLADDESVERIYPTDPSTGFYLFLQESGSEYQRGVRMRFRIRCGRGFTEEEFRTRVREVVQKHPVLRSRFTRAADGKAYQIIQKDMEIPAFYRDASSLSKEVRERFLSGFFQVLEEGESLFAAGCFPDIENSCDLLLCMRHTLLDGISAAVVINELAADSLPPGPDAFYTWREFLFREKDRIPEPLLEYYHDYGERMLLPSDGGKTRFEVRVREIAFDREATRRILEKCAGEQVSLVTYTEYSYGKSLLQAAGRDWLWFSHLYSGRDAELSGIGGIAGNLFYTMPVRIRSGMSIREFQEELLIPWQYPYSTENSLYRRLNSRRVEEGIVSNTFIGFGVNVLDVWDYEEKNRTGHSMRLKDGCLTVVLRHLDGQEENAAYDMIEEMLRGMPL